MDGIFLETITHLNDDTQERRNAYNSIDGYFYQFELTLYHILIDCTLEEPFDGTYLTGPLGETKIELIEDYVKFIDLHGSKLIRFGQIKHHNGYSAPYNYREPILFLYYNYLKFTQLNNGINYKARIFYYSSNNITTSILTLLHDAMEENEAKINDGKSPLPIYQKIITLALDTQSVRQSFSQTMLFTKTCSRNDLRDKIKNKIRNLIPKSRLSDELLISAGVAKIIESGRNSELITQQTIIDFLTNDSDLISMNVYIELINGLIKYLTNRFLSAIEDSLKTSGLPPSEKDEVFKKYLVISESIYAFIIINIKNPGNYESFLLTISPQAGEFTFGGNYQRCYELFLAGTESIFSFIVKLAKIAYYHWFRFNEQPNIPEWFEINNSRWLFRHPHEERDNGIIIGSLNNGLEFNASLGEIASRYLDNTSPPNVWYYMKQPGEQCFNNNNPLSYKLDILKVNPEFSPTQVNNDYFYLECMTCLEDDKCEKTDRLNNIFAQRCFNETR